MNKFKMYQEYCTGCGLCNINEEIKFRMDENGYKTPYLEKNTQRIIDFWENACPASGVSLNKLDPANIWGKTEHIYIGYSLNEEIRYQASSGGILTTIALYLLQNNIVDGIIQTKVSDTTPYETKTCCSTSAEEVLNCSGSRYSASSPLLNIEEYICSGMKYAFIGKPCDVTALKNYMNVHPELDNIFPYTFSFFCAGMPSKYANENLLQKLGCSVDDCKTLNYRGNGWPGYTIAVDSKGKEYQMDYKTAWSKILGRDVRKICRLCMDGIGEAADISCGDAWFVTADGRADLSEHNGRNAIFARNEQGEALLNEMQKKGLIHLENYQKYESELKKIQFYQYDRRGTMLSKIIAMKVCMRLVPRYKLKYLISYCKYSSIKRQLRLFIGTIGRIIQKRI